MLLGSTNPEEDWDWVSFNGHPPLGVNATNLIDDHIETEAISFNGHPPLGVNATRWQTNTSMYAQGLVSTGTHPWG